MGGGRGKEGEGQVGVRGVRGRTEAVAEMWRVGLHYLAAAAPHRAYRTLPSACWSLAHAAMTNASLTDTQYTSSTFLALIAAACFTKPGRCVAEQPGVNAVVGRGGEGGEKGWK